MRVADETDCDAGIVTHEYSLLIEQEGNDLTVWQDTDAMSGSINGSQVSWTGSIDEGSGITNYTCNSLSLNAEGTQLEGSCTWSWSDGEDSCDGSSSLTCTKNP